ncbi:hypothetical protein CHS0354_019384, partial [Potamilus streckersoni]
MKAVQLDHLVNICRKWNTNTSESSKDDRPTDVMSNDTFFYLDVAKLNYKETYYKNKITCQ